MAKKIRNIIIIYLFLQTTLGFVSLCNDPLNDPLIDMVSTHDERYFFLKHQYKWLHRGIYDLIVRESIKNKIDYRLIISLINTESEGRRTAVSESGAIGYMQVMAKYHYSGDPRDLFQTKLNISLGTRIFRDCFELANGNLVMALKYYERGTRGKGFNYPYIVRILKNYFKSRPELRYVHEI